MGGALGLIDFMTQTDPPPPAVVKDQQPIAMKAFDGFREIGDDLALLGVAETAVTVVDIAGQCLGQVVVRRARVSNPYGAVVSPKCSDDSLSCS